MKKILQHLESTRQLGAMADGNRHSLLGLGGLGLGAGLVGALMLGLRYLVRPPTKERIPETISPQKFSAQAFQTSRGQMVYHTAGNGPGPSLIFIHNVGVGASGYEWSKVYPAFASGHRVLALDLLGFGESERPHAKLTAIDYAESLAEFIGGLCAEETQRPVIVARGLGAGFAALMAARHPDLAGRLLLWMPSGRARVPWLLDLASRVPTLNRYIYRNRLARRATIRARFEARGAFVDPRAVTQEMVDMHAICAQQFQADYAIFRLLQGKMSFDLDACFRQVQAPVTVLWPDLLVGSAGHAHARSLQSASRLCALRVVPEAGPFAPLETPERVISVLADELKGELRVLRAAG